MPTLSEESLRELSALSAVALGHDDLSSAMDDICRIAVRAIPGADGASLTSLSENGPGAVASSDDWARNLDELQFEEREGPCLDAARVGLVFRVRDTAADQRWPSYLPRAVDEGVRSIVSLPMTVDTKIIGALNVYSREVDRFDSDTVSLAEIIAGHASLACLVTGTLIGHKELAGQLREAIASRATIEQAKGIIMATARKGPDAAFDMLKLQSQHENRKLRDIAEELVRRHSGD